MRGLSLVYPFYENPRMLSHQYKVWAGYPDELKSRIEVVLVDDGSPSGAAADVPLPIGLPPLRIYRVMVDIPWHQHAARNLGAKMAEGQWLFLSDMDHVLPATSLSRLLDIKNKDAIYMFARLDAPNLKPTRRPDGSLKPHPNTFAMTRDLYWRIGGYDERFSGIYGTDSLFRNRAAAVANIRHLADVPIIRYPREVIPDASTTTLERKKGRGDAKALLMKRIAAEGSADKIETLTFPWERVV